MKIQRSEEKFEKEVLGKDWNQDNIKGLSNRNT